MTDDVKAEAQTTLKQWVDFAKEFIKSALEADLSLSTERSKNKVNGNAH
jgi:hypothetical protein